MDPKTKCDICGKVDGELKALTFKLKSEEAIAVVVKYKEFAEIEKIENLGKDNVLLAYDMDSRWVASKHILSNLQALKDKNK